MKFSEIINEGLSPVLFHFANLNVAHYEVTKNEAKLTPDLGTRAEREQRIGNKLYYMSTARTRTGAYHKDRNHGVLFTLDGRKLAHTFKGKALDYYTGAKYNYDADQYPDYSEEQKRKHPRRTGDISSEQEDRIFSDKPVIENFLDYVTHIDCIYDQEEPHISANEYTNQSIKKYQQIALAAKKAGIPVTFYTNMRDLIARNPNGVVKPSFGKVDKPKPPKQYSKTPSNKLAHWTELIHKKSRADLSSDADRLRQQISMWPQDAVRELENYIHGYRKSDRDFERNAIEKLIKSFQELQRKNKNGLDMENVSDMVRYLGYKWDAIR